MSHSPKTAQTSRDDLYDAIESTCIKCTELKFGPAALDILSALTSDDFTISHAADMHLRKCAEGLTEVITKDSRFPGEAQRMIQGDGSRAGFYPHFIHRHLICRAIRNESPESAISWLQKVLGTTEATGKTIHALWGVPVERTIQLTPDVTIVPINELPDSEQKKWILGPSFHEGPSLLASVLGYNPPQSALVTTRRISPYIVDPEIQTNLPDEEHHQTYRLLTDIALALTVVGPRVPIHAAAWFTFDDPDLEASSILSGSRRYQTHEIVPNNNGDYPFLDPDEAPHIVSSYLSLPAETKKKVQVALQRINQAQRRHNPGDRAVELSTAFEALLGDSGTTEMTHKIKVRSTRLIGGSDNVRRRNAAILGKTYSIRSQLVHTGEVRADRSENICGQPASVAEIVDLAVHMCVELAKVIIRRGSIPDWAIFDITEQTDG